MKEAPFVQLLDDLQKNYDIAFPVDPIKEKTGELHALRNLRDQCAQLMQDHFDDILELVAFKKPCIEHLTRLMAEYDRRIAELDEQLPDRRGSCGTQKEGDASTSTVERPLPKR